MTNLTHKFRNSPALAYLTCSLKNQGLTSRALLPSEQLGNDVSLDVHNNSCFTFYRRKVWIISHYSAITGAKVGIMHERCHFYKDIFESITNNGAESI